MIIKIPVSIGEVIDKISILLIKMEKITDIHKIQYIKKEFDELNHSINEKNLDENKIKEFLDEMLKINTKLWNIEDKIRECERARAFDQLFIDLARSVYKNNDIRAEIKLRINKEFNSEMIEVKSYSSY